MRRHRRSCRIARGGSTKPGYNQVDLVNLPSCYNNMQGSGGDCVLKARENGSCQRGRRVN